MVLGGVFASSGGGRCEILSQLWGIHSPLGALDPLYDNIVFSQLILKAHIIFFRSLFFLPGLIK